MAMEFQGAAELLAWGQWDLPENNLDIQQLKTGYLAARSLCEAYHSEAKRLRDSRHYSEVGLKEEMASFGKEQLEKLKTIHRDIIEPRSRKLAQMEAEMLPRREPTMVEAIRQLEIRSLLQEQPREVVFMMLREAAVKQDDEMLEAVVQGPVLFRQRMGLDDRLVQEMRHRLIEARSDPEVLKRHQELHKALDLARQAFESACKQISGGKGFTVDDQEIVQSEMSPKNGEAADEAETV